MDRLHGELGYCAMPAQLHGAKAMLHRGEEPAICGDGATGAVFFTGCNLRCVYCQNREISHNKKGIPLSSQGLREIFMELIHQGARSIDLVTPGHFLPHLLPALRPKLPVPVVYNCGGYESVESLRRLEGLVDIYLPDFKYSDCALSQALSGCADYPEVAKAALQEMFRQTGPAVYENGQMLRGVLVRHLVLPGHVENSLGVLDSLAELFPQGGVPISLMSQYVPDSKLPAPLNRSITREEYAAVLSWMELLGFREGYMQGMDSATQELLPQFDFGGLQPSGES